MVDEENKGEEKRREAIGRGKRRRKRERKKRRKRRKREKLLLWNLRKNQARI